ncbi:hypothetical protein A3F08_03185 [Candidatus Berkelbacteria bacterium RIFCSPHIGHO2_12_FULL_36_9]|uniref:Polymerase nucleotidyl transferase domain-containing protein n=1 Tax=Candidatus Berkelbacteria bacterium RIFCSPHIGHO2_12_FULL_36_9 TaxID=1797469 RepID=A0A1F5EKG9_9BACT|nr:MAG: hypothetical protein A3F08_03185 [Candidatus Berkelbacteria bacterium RIFCSPHIGHO2_12_FULL_36_9]
MSKNVLYNQRLKKASQMASLLCFIPYIRGVLLTGSMAEQNIKEESDIDFFVQTKKGRIWMTRGLVVFFLTIIGQYRSKRITAGKICPNWYAIYNAPKKTNRRHIVLTKDNNFLGKSLEIILSNKFGDLLEKMFKNYQIRRIENNPSTFKYGSEVRFSDKELGFHPHDKI